MRALNLAVNVLQSVAAIILGLHFMNIDLMAHLADSNLVFLVKPIQVLFGLSGLYGLYSLFMCNECC